MSRLSAFRGVPLPNDWSEYVKLAVIHSIALAHKAITYSRSFAINSSIERVRLAGQLDRAQSENALLEEEIRIKDARMATIPRKVKKLNLIAEALFIGPSEISWREISTC